MIVIGGSTGSHQPLKTILRDLPPDLDAAVLVLRHTWPDAPSVLGQVLRPLSALAVEEIEDGATVRPRRVYVAPPGRNVTFGGDAEAPRFRLVPCAGQRRGRPNIDVSLAAAARLFDEDCIGVILSGYLDDGTDGAIAVGAHRGVIIAQAPSDAEQPSMPLNVIDRDSPEYVLPDIQIAATLRDLVLGRIPAEGALPLVSRG